MEGHLSIPKDPEILLCLAATQGSPSLGGALLLSPAKRRFLVKDNFFHCSAPLGIPNL